MRPKLGPGPKLSGKGWWEEATGEKVKKRATGQGERGLGKLDTISLSTETLKIIL